MFLLYELLLVRPSCLILKILSFFIPKIKKIVLGRNQTKAYFLKSAQSTKERIYFHCASMGEWEIAIPVARIFQQQGYEIYVSFFSPSGFEHFKEPHLITKAFYLPADIRKNHIHYLSKIKPKAAILVRYDIWPAQIKSFKDLAIPTFLIAAEYDENHLFFGILRSYFLPLLKQFSRIFVNDAASQHLLLKHNVHNVVLSGSPKYSRALEHEKQRISIPQIDIFCENNRILILGSCWKREVDLACSFYYSKKIENFKIIFAPHDISKEMVDYIQSKCSNSGILYTNLNQKSILELKNATILIINNIGLLSQLYQKATIALVGGGFGKGIHNILEPAVSRIPTLFGPNFKKFSEARFLIKNKLAFSIKNQKELNDKIDTFLHHPENFNLISDNFKKILEENLKSPTIITQIILKYIPEV